MTLDIRQLTADDAIEMRALRLLGLRTDAHAFGASFETESKQPLPFFEQRCTGSDYNRLFGAFVNQQLVALTSLVRESGMKSQHYAGIYAVYTHPDFRGNGISSALLQSAIHQAQLWSGVDFLKLGVNSTNTVAVRMYQQAGFQIVGTIPSALRIDKTDYDEHVMVLDLRTR